MLPLTLNSNAGNGNCVAASQKNRLYKCVPVPSAPPLLPIGVNYQYGVFPQ